VARKDHLNTPHYSAVSFFHVAAAPRYWSPQFYALTQSGNEKKRWQKKNSPRAQRQCTLIHHLPSLIICAHTKYNPFGLIHAKKVDMQLSCLTASSQSRFFLTHTHMRSVYSFKNFTAFIYHIHARSQRLRSLIFLAVISHVN
jgi:hypothetical protein